MSRTSVKSRLLLRSPTEITGSCLPFSMRATWRAKEEFDEILAPARAAVIEAPRYNAADSVALVILVGEHLLGHLAHRVGREGAQGVALLHRHLVRVDHAVFLGRACYLDEGVYAYLAYGFKKVQLADNVVLEGGGRGVPGGWNVTLRGQVENAVGAHGGDQFVGAERVHQVALNQVDFVSLEGVLKGANAGDARLNHMQVVLGVGDVLQAAPPAVDAEDLGIGVLGKQVVHQMTPREAGNARNKNSQKGFLHCVIIRIIRYMDLTGQLFDFGLFTAEARRARRFAGGVLVCYNR